MNSFENVSYETKNVSLEETLKETKELLNKLHKTELEYYELKAENRKRRAEQGLPW